MPNNITFEHVHTENADGFKKLFAEYPKYKIQTLRNHGEYPFGKKLFRRLLSNSIENAANSEKSSRRTHIVAMRLGKKVIGMAIFEPNGNELPEIPFPGGNVSDFMIIPKFRRKGYGKMLNKYIESIFLLNGTTFVYLHPDPVTGLAFWESQGYIDTGINKHINRFKVYIKHLQTNEKTEEINRAIKTSNKPADWSYINLYDKRQMQEVEGLWADYKRETAGGEKLKSKRKLRKELRARAAEARKTREKHFNALYFEGEIIGFAFYGKSEKIEDKGEVTQEFYIKPGFCRKKFSEYMKKLIEDASKHDESDSHGVV